MSRQKTTPGLIIGIKKIFTRMIISPLQDSILFLSRLSRLRNDDFNFW